MGRLLDWFERERRDLPWRRTRDAYAIWVSEVMLQQTQVRTVIPYWERWMGTFPTPLDLAAAPEATVLKAWEGLGYYRRARYLHAAAREIRDRHGGRFPEDPEAIRALPGVGRYTLGAVGSIAFGHPLPVVDGNVARVLTRLQAAGGDPAKSPLRELLWEWAEALVRAAAATGRLEACGNLNQSLMELGALVCLPRGPRCDRCPLAPECAGRKSGDPERFPESAARPQTVPRFGVVVVAERSGRYWVRRRDAAAVNGGLWEFPNEVEDAPPDSEDAAVIRVLGGRGWGSREGKASRGAAGAEPLGEIQHSITRYRIRLRVFRLRMRGNRQPASPGEWRGLDELRALPFTTAHRRILGWLAKAEGPGKGGGKRSGERDPGLRSGKGGL